MAVAWPLSHFPLLPGAKASFAAAVLLFSTALFGIVPLLANAAVVAAVQITSSAVSPVPFAECLVLLGAAWLLQSRVPITVGIVAYGVMQVALLALFAPAAGKLQLADLTPQIIASIFNFALASLAISLLPRRSRRWPDLLRGVPRRSLAKLVFSTATVTTVLALVVVTRGTTLLIATLATMGIFAALAHLTSAWAKVPPQSRTQRRLSLANASYEAAGTALGWLRRLHDLQRLMKRSNQDLTMERVEGARYRAEVLNLNARLQEQTQTRQREASSLHTMDTKLRETQSAIEHVRHHHKLFIAMMSHEVRTPLHGLMSTLSLLREEEKLSTEGERQLAIARTSARALLKIANDILDLSRIEAGGFSFENKPFNPRRLVDEIIAEFLATAQAQKLELSARTTDNVPATLVGDRDRIYQIVSNLVSNAVKFTPSGRVTVRVAYDDGVLTIDVVDTGAGIPAEKRETIFDSFVQADVAQSRRFSGSGLGLTISRHLAQAMGGSLRLHATGRSGSTFRLQIALERSTEEAVEEQSARILTQPTGHILVVEDNDVNQYVARVMLENLGCTVTVAENGAVALDAARRDRFDLVLMDCELPVMDGYEASARLRSELGLNIPIIAMTANALPADRERARQAGMNDYLTKPFTKSALSRLLNQWLPTTTHAVDDEAAWPALDLTVLQELWESVGWRTSALRKIYESFIANVRSAIYLLATDNPPLPQVRRALHTIRGSGGMVGAMRIARAVATLEHALGNNQLTQEAIQTVDLARELREFESALEQRLATHGDAPQGRY